jgi:phosphopantetheinyl transferase
MDQHGNVCVALQRSFYVHWALKESYVKATGAGIGFGLPRISFQSAPQLDTAGFGYSRAGAAAAAHPTPQGFTPGAT